IPTLSTIQFIFFFFQAEDGIRDRNVTGVQTCALPISESVTVAPLSAFPKASLTVTTIVETFAPLLAVIGLGAALTEERLALGGRSEERRVGKEGRRGWAV